MVNSMTKENLNPNALPVVGIIGGGQLGKMLAQVAKRMGHRVIILDPTPECPAAQVSDEQLVAPYTDTEALKTLNEKADVITFEFENMPVDLLESHLDPERFVQGTKALAISQDRLAEKAFLRECGLKTAPYAKIESFEDLKEALEGMGYPAVLKTTRFGYDGKGQIVLESEADLKATKPLIDEQTCILEGFVPFEAEASVMVARNPQGEMTTLPIGENRHVNNILHASLVPAALPEATQDKMIQEAKTLCEALDYVGILGIEYFVCQDEVLVNEIAPRPHNSGHYSIEACDFSQFNLHMRGVLNLPLPEDVQLLKPAVMVNILGQHLAACRKLENDPAFVRAQFHDYGKAEARVDRKMGHITELGADPEKLYQKFTATKIWD